MMAVNVRMLSRLVSRLPIRPTVGSRGLRTVSILYQNDNAQNQEKIEDSLYQDDDVSQTNLIDSLKAGGIYQGAGLQAFDAEITEKLNQEIHPNDVEIKPDGLIYLPEIKYRRKLNEVFGPGGWALIPLGESLQFEDESGGSFLITREYCLYCMGRFVSQTVGEHTFYSRDKNMFYGKAMESAKSNALMRCCKDLGIASELWDPTFVLNWKKDYAVQVWIENAQTKQKKRAWRRKDRDGDAIFVYPWKEATF